MTRILEGTWAEIAAHVAEREDEWNGRQLRVQIEETAATEAPDSEREEPTLLEMLGDIVGSVEGMPEDLGRNHKFYYSQAMDEKYPKSER